MEWWPMSGAVIRTPYQKGTDLLWELYDRNRLLCLVALCNVGLAVVFTLLIQIDSRSLLGRNIWTKPWKFATSIAIFTATMAWLLPSLSLSDRVERLTTYTVASAMIIEISLISMQAARGVRSHFNYSTPLDSTIAAVMGLTITINTLVIAFVLWRIVRRPPDLAPAYLWGIWIGVFLFVAASFQGWVMIGYDSHSIGAPAGGPGLPLLNWSVTGGDLRIAHFIGLHSLQVLPFTGYVAARWPDTSPRISKSVVGVVAVLYGSLVGGTFAWALLGNPLVPSLPVVSMAGIFGASFLLVAPFWALMILTPTWDVTRNIIESPLIALPAGLLYLFVLLPQAGAVAGVVVSPSLTEMAQLLATEAGATLAWVHFLAFDLFVGRWIYRDAIRRNISQLVVSPILVLTLLFGPVGYLTYCTIRGAVAND
jgi:hypothetical protein